MLPISRAEAITAGTRFYFPLTPCRNGHVSPREVVTYKCIKCRDESVKRWKARNPEKVKEINARDVARIQERLKQDPTFALKRKEYGAVWRNKPENRERLQKQALEWHRQNRHRHAAQASARRHEEYKATPSWLTESMQSQIDKIYLTSQRASLSDPHEVDHIISILGEDVCGLHVPWNLRVIGRGPNRAKGNRLPPPEDWLAYPDGSGQFA